MRTAVVILNWNTRYYLDSFLPVLLDSTKDLAEVIVADNASTDGSAELMTGKFPDVKKISFSENYGYTGGYNRALDILRAYRYDYYVLLNSDVEVTQGWLPPLVNFMDSHPDCGACAPKLHSWHNRDSFEYAGACGGLLDSLGYPFCRGRVMKHTEKDEGQYDSLPHEVFWVGGACLMVRASAFHALGGLDDRFFAHMEEIDLCWRLQRIGYKVCCIPDSTIWHIGGGTLPDTSPWKLKLNFRNNLFMLENNLAYSYALRACSGEDDLEKIAERACKKSRKSICRRMLADGCAAAIYLLTGKLKYCKAVVGAHREFRSGRRPVKTENVVLYLKTYGAKAKIHGWYKGLIVPLTVIYGKRISLKIKKLIETGKL